MNAYEIKKFRDEHNMSQSQLAELLGTSVRAVQSWEQGVRNISQSSAKLLKVYSEEHNVSHGGDKKDISTLCKNHFESLGHRSGAKTYEIPDEKQEVVRAPESESLTIEERLLRIIESQQRVIEQLTNTVSQKKAGANMAARVAGAG